MKILLGVDGSTPSEATITPKLRRVSGMCEDVPLRPFRSGPAPIVTRGASRSY